MRETIYLAVSRSKVERMNKSMPQLGRGEIPIKLVLEVDDEAFREPIIEKHVTISDWRQGVDIADVEFRESVITEAEAAMVRDSRLKKMKEILEEKGYQVTAPETED